MPKVKGQVLRGQFDSWRKRGLVNGEVARARYVKTFKMIEREDSQDAAIRFTICLVLADAFFETLIPFWKMTVAMKRYKLGRDFEGWFKKKAGLYKNKTKSVSAFELFAFIKQPELIRLHDYLWYYRGHSEIKKVGWGNYLEFCEFVEALEKDLLKFKKAMKEMVLLWERYVRDKVAFFTSEEFSIRDFKKKRELILALHKSISKERKTMGFKDTVEKAKQLSLSETLSPLFSDTERKILGSAISVMERDIGRVLAKQKVKFQEKDAGLIFFVLSKTIDYLRMNIGITPEVKEFIRAYLQLSFNYVKMRRQMGYRPPTQLLEHTIELAYELVKSRKLVVSESLRQRVN